MSSFMQRLQNKEPINWGELRQEASAARRADYEEEERAARKAEEIVRRLRNANR